MADQTSTIPKNWGEATLGDAVETIDGDRGVNYPKNNEFFSEGYCLFLNTKNVPNNSFSFEEKMFVDKEKDLKLRKGKLKRGDFVLTTRGTVGNFAFYSEKVPFDNIRINSGMVILRARDKVLNKSYLNFYLKSYFFNDQVFSRSSGTAQPQLPIRDLTVFQIYLPPLPEQQAIATMLSSLENKIEFLREQNKTMEATAQAIFKEWFVNFNFPGATGKMIDSELGEIPEGWRVGKFGDELKIEYGKSDKEFDADGIYPVYGAGGILGYTNSADYKDYQVIVGCRGTCGNITLAYEDSKITHNSLIISNNWFKPFIYLYLQSIDIRKAITGSTQPQITIGDLSNIEILVPQNKIIDQFSKTIAPIFKKIKNNNSQIQTLSALRDTLLPKLMKGAMRVRGFND